MKRIFICLLAFLMFGCSEGQESEGAKRHAEFKPEQYKPYAVKGKGRIKGSFCIELDNGQERCLAQQLVLLNPVTDYSTEWYERYWKNGEILESPHNAAAARSRLVRTMSNGDFVFYSLPPGEYYVAAVACPYAGNGDKRQPFNYQRWGAKVTLAPGVKSVKAVLEKVLEYEDEEAVEDEEEAEQDGADEEEDDE